MSILEKLTEGIERRDLQKDGARLLNKWERTGLLEGMKGDQARAGMAQLLENQAKQLLQETSSMAAGDVEGFASVAFPLVRRVFGGLLANDLVSVQPMSLPSGLIFFLDFTVSDETGTRLSYESGDSLYGGGVVAKQLTGGVNLTGSNAEDSAYNLNNGYSSPTGSATVAITALDSGTVGSLDAVGGTGDWRSFGGLEANKLMRWDPDFTSGSTLVAIGRVQLSSLAQVDEANLQGIVVTLDAGSTPLAGGATQVRRLTQYSGSAKTHALVFFSTDNGTITQLSGAVTGSKAMNWPEFDDFTAGGAVGAVVGTTTWGLENEANIPEIDIKVDSISVTTKTKKLKAKWTPELGQDLNAYHNLDAEVELTSILSEQIALEIDREILEDLLKLATAGTYYWSRSPGMFLNRTTGGEIGASTAAPDFTGTVSEWYETLIETINDVSAQIHRKTLRGGANFVVCGPEVANILEFTAGFRASVTGDDDRGTIGAVNVGSLSKKFEVYVDPYFPRNVVLVGRKGGSFLESGYVYAPYVPLQVTPTIFGVEDFVPRKGVMTRYAKKMVRPDMYGLVIVRGLLGESGT